MGGFLYISRIRLESLSKGAYNLSCSFQAIALDVMYSRSGLFYDKAQAT